MYIIKVATLDGPMFVSKKQGVEQFTRDLADALETEDWRKASEWARITNEQLEADGEPVKACNKRRYAYIVKKDIEEYIEKMAQNEDKTL